MHFSWQRIIFSYKQYYDVTPMDYVVNRKMEEGKCLLKHSKMKVKEIAEELGYEDSLYFSKVFKKAAGMSPKQYMTYPKMDT